MGASMSLRARGSDVAGLSLVTRCRRFFGCSSYSRLALREPLTSAFAGGRYWDRTSDLFGVNADRPCVCVPGSVITCR